MPSTRFKNVADLYNGIAAQYNENRHKATNDVVEFPAIMKLAGSIKGKKILDVGCGTGKHAKGFLAKGAIVTGIDASREMIKIAKHACGGQGSFLAANFEKVDFPAEYFDLINASLSLHYSNRLDHIFKKFNFWLKPGGKMLFTIYHPIQYFLRVKNFDFSKSQKVWIKLQSYDVEVFNYYHPLGEYIDAIKMNGFCIQSIAELTVPKNVKGWPKEKYTIPSCTLFEITHNKSKPC